MSIRKFNSLLMIAVFALAFVSCKDDDTEVTPSLSGIYFHCPSYVAPGQAVTMNPKGLTHPEGGVITYKWRVTPSMSESIETETFVHWFSDTLGTYSVSCYATAEGYAGDTYSKSVKVVKGGLDGSITNTGIESGDPKITVDGHDYYYKSIGGLDWFRNNLEDSSMGAPYDNADATTCVFGRFYTYEEAVNACPQGWRLPTEEDWMSLAAAVGSAADSKYLTFTDVAAKMLANASFNGEQMLEYWPVVGEITNESGLSMIPSGFANLGEKDSEGKYPEASFTGHLEYAAFWTADKVVGEDDMAYFRYLINDQPDMLVGKGKVKSFGASVRCVRESI